MRSSVTTMVISSSSGPPRRECHHFRNPPLGRAEPVGALDNVRPLTSPPPRAPNGHSRTNSSSLGGRRKTVWSPCPSPPPQPLKRWLSPGGRVQWGGAPRPDARH